MGVILLTGWMARRSLQSIWAPAPKAEVELPQRGGTLTTSLRLEPRTFNRLSAGNLATETVAQLTQAKLVRVNRQTQDVEPWLAEKWEAAADGRTYTLTLRDGLQWSDGTPFTSADVTFTAAAVYAPQSASILASALQVDHQPLAVTAPDARTVVVTFPAPFGPGLRLLDNLYIYPRHKLGAALQAGTFGEAWGVTTPPADMPGMGPFVLDRYEPGQRLVFARNARYWRKDERGTQLPYLDQVVVEILPDENAELLRLQAGELDMTQQHIRPQDLASARRQEGQGTLRLFELGVSLDPDAFFLNERPAKWGADPRGTWINRAEFRQALSHAVDREAYARTVFLGAAVPVHGPISPGNRQWFWPDLPRLRWDQDRSKLLLEQLGLKNRDADPWLEDEAGTEARFSVLVFRGNSSIERGVQVLADYFRAIGVALDVVPLEPGAVIQRMLAGDFEAIFFNYIATATDPALQRDFWLSSGSAHMWNLEQKTPATDWERQIDELMTKQAASSDPAERVRLFRDVQKIFAEQVPVLYFAAPRLFIGVSSRVRNETPGLTRPQLLWSADTLAVAAAEARPATGGAAAGR